MEQAEDQSTSGSSSGGGAGAGAASGGNSRPAQIAQMSLYERQAVQALQALQRQPNAAQYFQQLMLQQQINNAQLHNLAAVQQATLAASRQSSCPNNSVSAVSTANLSSTTGGGTMTNPRPVGPVTSVTSSALSQSVLLGGNSAAQGQMYLRVNRPLRAPLTSHQLIFMPGGTATAAVATVAQQQPQQQQQHQQQEVPPTSSNNQPDNDQVQNLALRCVSTPRVAAVKTEYPDRKDSGSYCVPPQSQQQQQQFPQTAQQISTTKLQTPPSSSSTSLSSSSSTSSPSLPLSQLLLSPSRLAPAATVTHILVPSNNVPTSSPGFPKPSMAAQTLVVQPLQQQQQNGAEKLPGPIPIQPKTAQSNRMPSQMPPRHPPPILPAPPNPHPPPHVPVQLLGSRQGTMGNAQAVAVAQARTCYTQQDSSVHSHNHSSSPNTATMMTAMESGPGTGLKPASQNLEPGQNGSAAAQVIDVENSSAAAPPAGETAYDQPTNTQMKPAIGSLKRKSESDMTGEMTSEVSPQSCPSAPDSAPPLSPAPSMETTSETAFSTPPTLSLSHPRAPVPQAVVKPQVLTHLIEGFVIQEGAEPFPVTGPIKEHAMGVPVAVPRSMQSENSTPAVLKCEFCESFAPASQFRGSKRFCSKTCAKRYNVSCSHHFRTSQRRSGAPVPEGIARRRGPRRSSSEIACAKIAGRHVSVKCRSESSRSEDVSSCEGEEEEEEDSLSPSSSFSCSRPAHCTPELDQSAPAGLPLDGDHFLPANPAHWGVEEVCRFISSLQGCEELAGHFLSQEIDGQALLLLKEEHLMSTMNIKLGPALKICASINSLRD
ncbi:polyhomeotic-like protein 1 [Trichomycterus rosablanca]|uniref:polyhomeotic-like protein 1 n=1 Tax=Trichomycterus rosablanca TaxID=2290929 RepID=UPI002F3528ED